MPVFYVNKMTNVMLSSAVIDTFLTCYCYRSGSYS